MLAVPVIETAPPTEAAIKLAVPPPDWAVCVGTEIDSETVSDVPPRIVIAPIADVERANVVSAVAPAAITGMVAFSDTAPVEGDAAVPTVVAPPFPTIPPKPPIPVMLIVAFKPPTTVVVLVMAPVSVNVMLVVAAAVTDVLPADAGVAAPLVPESTTFNWVNPE